MNVEDLKNELDCLLEIRGELSEADNTRVERRITEVLELVLVEEGIV